MVGSVYLYIQQFTNFLYIYILYITQLLFRIHLNSPVLQLAWHGGRGTLACVTEDSTVVLNESVMHARMNGDLSVSYWRRLGWFNRVWCILL